MSYQLHCSLAGRIKGSVSTIINVLCPNKESTIQWCCVVFMVHIMIKKKLVDIKDK